MEKPDNMTTTIMWQQTNLGPHGLSLLPVAVDKVN